MSFGPTIPKSHIRNVALHSAKDILRIHVISDLHNGTVYAKEVQKLANEVKQNAPDLLIIAGDVVNGPEDGPEVYRETLEAFRGRWLTAVLVGNHDLWSRKETGYPTSRELWKSVLPKITRDAGAIWLETEPLVIQGARLAIAGTIGWYDYAADATGRSPDEIARAKGQWNADADNINWPWNDQKFAEACRRSLQGNLERLSARKDVERILVATHVPPFRELRPPAMREGADYERYYRQTEAYFFSPQLGALILQFPKVTHVAAGHTHAGIKTFLERPGSVPIDARVVDVSDENEILRYEFPVFS